MKNYKIDYLSGTVSITKKFAKEAGILGTPEFDTMQQLMELGFKIITPTPKKTHGQRQWTYNQMERYILACENAEEALQDFETLKKVGSYATVWKWFRNAFPNYNGIPMMNDDHKIIQMPTIGIKVSA